MSTPRTEDLHISLVRPLITPLELSKEFTASTKQMQLVADSRKGLEAILDGRDPRCFVVVGPCSIHDTAAAVDYAGQLAQAVKPYTDQLLPVMRVYFEKPRTVVGWKGLINDPDLDNSYHINKGLRLARKLLLDVLEIGLPTGTEFLDTTFGQYYADLVSWGAIGARTVESQIHRELASGLSMPVGIKNRTDGNVQVAVEAIRAAAERHIFPTLTKEGTPAIYETTGNRHCHLILRGGGDSGPNFSAPHIDAAAVLLRPHEICQKIVVDCSHGNSQKKAENQALVVADLARQIGGGDDRIAGIMLESHLRHGRQDYRPDQPATYGLSITDACISLQETVPLLEQLAEAVARGRQRPV
ncbi:MAG: 3-deoxy-7-phosphoheptulonate synthase [Gammaproteobacteria bacterium]|nr:3-deoxy-7-phosphoheptulonate synthase [Gammaproteobacteria bacterium]